MYSPEFDEKWPHYFDELENETKTRTAKKIKKVLEQPKKRHMKTGAAFFVAETGQHRIVYRVFEQEGKVRFYFVGDHKQYEKWYKQFF